MESNNWTDIQLAYMTWLALPKAERRPKTQRAFAAQFDVAEETLSRWKRLPGFSDATIVLAREFVKDDVPDILAKIRSLAKDGSIAHINMALAMAGMAPDVSAAGRGPGAVKAYVTISPDDWDSEAS